MGSIIAFLTTGWGQRLAAWAAAIGGIILLLLKARSDGKAAANAEHARKNACGRAEQDDDQPVDRKVRNGKVDVHGPS